MLAEIVREKFLQGLRIFLSTMDMKFGPYQEVQQAIFEN